MVLSPPLCLPFRSITINSQPTSNTWDVTLLITDPQGTGSGVYDGTTIAVNQWIGTGSYGYAFRINSITSQSSSSVRCIIEDVDNWNLNQDPSSGIDGGGPIDGNIGFVFELGLNGLPTLTEVVVFPNITWTDSLFGRFNSVSQQSGGGNLYKSYFQSNFTTPNENDTLQLTHTGLKNLAYTPGESVIITSTLYDAIIYNAGNATSAGSVLYYGGNASNDTLLYYAGNSGSVGTGAYLNAGNATLSGAGLYYGGNAYSNGVNGFIVNAGNASTTYQSTQTYIVSGGSGSSNNDLVYNAGNATSAFGQLIKAGSANTLYTNLNTTLEGIINFYDQTTGNIILEQLTNIYGIFGGVVDYTINLTGKRGTSIFSNYGPPIQQIGRFGDTYIDRATKDFYIKQSAWVPI